MKVYVKDVRENESITSVFQVARKTVATARNGKPFIALTLRDKTGELDARIWEQIEEIDPLFAKDDLVEVEAQGLSFQGHVQLKIDRIKKADPSTQDESDFPPPATPVSPPPRGDERHVAAVVDLLGRVHDPHLSALLKSFTDDEQFLARFRRAPAAKTVHHARHGGLAEHTLSVMRLAQRVADHYPMVDRDLLLAGAFLHDVCKVDELRYDKQTEYTDEGRLVGHLIMGAQLLREKALSIPGFPKALEVHLTHIIIAHHGTLEHGSPCLPQTLEAHLVHALDDLDSRMASWLDIMQRDPGETWTDFQKLYNRHLYKGAPPLAGARPPVERRKKHRPDAQARQQAAAAARPVADGGAAPTGDAVEGAAPTAPREKRPRRERPERTDRPDRGDRPERTERPERGGGGKPEVKLTFKPFAALTPTAPIEPEPIEAAPATESAASAETLAEATPQVENIGAMAESGSEAAPTETKAPDEQA